VFKRSFVMLLIVLLVAGLVACSKDVKRVDVDEDIDLSGRWNDTDSRMVSDAMISDCLKGGWLPKFASSNGGKAPVVIVGTVRNKSHEHINVATFTKDLERALINSGEVEFVASSAQRDEIREEREQQAVFSSEETAKEHGQEVGADYMLKGEINSIKDKEGRKSLVYYQVDLELIHIETNKKVWIGDKKIKKLIKKPRFGL